MNDASKTFQPKRAMSNEEIGYILSHERWAHAYGTIISRLFTNDLHAAAADELKQHRGNGIEQEGNAKVGKIQSGSQLDKNISNETKKYFQALIKFSVEISNSGLNISLTNPYFPAGKSKSYFSQIDGAFYRHFSKLSFFKKL